MKILFVLALMALGLASANHHKHRSAVKSHVQKAVKSTFSSRIVGGAPVDIADYGWQVSIQRLGHHICGGSIIDKHWILTAAHCVEGISTAIFYSVRVGSNISTEGGSQHNIARIIKHPDYVSKAHKNDAAVLQLISPLPLNDDTIRAVNVVGQGVETPVGTTVTVTGWGAVTQDGGASPLLYGVSIPVMENSLCYKGAKGSAYITDSVICAGYSDGGKDSCQGDSGGPLVDGSNTLIGIVSWGIGCAQPNKPGVYTKLASPDIRNFITQYVSI